MKRTVLLLWFLAGTACAVAEDVDAMTAYERAADPDRRAIERLRYARIAIGSGELSREQLADAYYYEGESYYYLRNYADALRSYDEVLRLFPQDGMTYGAIGHVAYMRRDYDDAIANYRRALDITGDRAWADAMETAHRERAQEREAASRPPPIARGRNVRLVELIYIGFRAEKIQPDGAFKKTNEIGVHCDASAPDVLGRFGFQDEREGVKNGTRVVINKVAWRGPIDARVTIELEMNELEPYEGPSLGRRYNPIGKTTIHSVPREHLTRDWLSEHGFHYHIKVTMTGGGSRYHVYFQYRLAR